MKRLLLIVGSAVLISMGAATAVSATTPPAEVPATASPIVGTWFLNDVGEFADEGFTGAFLADGVYVQVDETFSIGAWAATGPDTFDMTYTDISPEGTFTVRAAITVSGDTLTADFTLEFAGEGAPEPAGQYGPGQVEGTRIVPEPIGTPVGTLDELFAQFGPPASAPPTTG